MVQSLSCYFEPEHKQFYSVIQLGTNICGYKRIVHGRITSSPLDAIVTACLNGRGHQCLMLQRICLQVGLQLQCVMKPLAGFCSLSGVAMVQSALHEHMS